MKFTRSKPIEQRTLSHADIWATGYDSVGAQSSAGEKVDWQSAMTLSAVYGSVRILSHGVAQASIRTTKGEAPSEKPAANPAWLMTPDMFFTSDVINQIMWSLLLRGNAYVATIRRGDLSIVGIRVLDPDSVEPVSMNGTVYYQVGNQRLTGLDVLHIPGQVLRPGELKADDPITYWKESVGLGLAAQRYGGELFDNGGLPGAVVELPREVEAPSKPALARMRAEWRELYGKKGNRGKLAVLTHGAQFRQVSITPENAQFLGTRGFQVADVARFFGVPPHLLQDATNSTSWGSGLAEQSQNFLVHSLRPWVMKLQTAFTWLARSEQPETVRAMSLLNVYLDLDFLTEGTFAERVDAFSKLFQAGGISHDEFRAEFGFPPLSDDLGKRFYVPVNLSVVNETSHDPNYVAPVEETESEPVEEEPEAPSETETRRAQLLEAIKAVQMGYLGVGVAMTDEEFRGAITELGLNLPGALPVEEEPEPEVDPEEETDEDADPFGNGEENAPAENDPTNGEENPDE